MMNDDILKKNGIYELLHTCLIQTYSTQIKNIKDLTGKSTGFFYCINDVVYVCTNTHCIYGSNYEIRKVVPRKIEIIYRRQKMNEYVECEYINYDLNIKDIRRHSTQDICLIKTNLSTKNMEYLMRKNIDWNSTQLCDYQKLFDMCIDMYPKICMYSEYTHNNMPLKRYGYLNTNIIDIYKSEILFGEIKTFGGCSGSPVYILLSGFVDLSINDLCIKKPIMSALDRNLYIKDDSKLLFIGINGGEMIKKNYVHNENNESNDDAKYYVNERNSLMRIVNYKYLLEIEDIITNKKIYQNELDEQQMISETYIDDDFE